MCLNISGEQCAGFPALYYVVKSLRPFTVCDNGVDAVCRGELCGLKLCAHAAGSAPGTGTACQCIDFLIDGVDLLDQFRVGVETRIAVIESVDVRQDDQTFCPAEHCNHGR